MLLSVADEGLLALRATLPTRLFEKLLVLLFAHALAALFDQASHNARQRNPGPILRTNRTRARGLVKPRDAPHGLAQWTRVGVLKHATFVGRDLSGVV